MRASPDIPQPQKRWIQAKNPYVLISVSENALQGHLDGTAPGHGWQNAPDFKLNDGYATCADQLADGDPFPL